MRKNKIWKTEYSFQPYIRYNRFKKNVEHDSNLYTKTYFSIFVKTKKRLDRMAEELGVLVRFSNLLSSTAKSIGLITFSHHVSIYDGCGMTTANKEMEWAVGGGEGSINNSSSSSPQSSSSCECNFSPPFHSPPSPPPSLSSSSSPPCCSYFTNK